MADILILPEIEQQIITQMIRQKEMSLAEIVAYTNQEEEVVSNMLNSLSKQGFVQELNSEGELRYRPRVAPKPPSKVSQNFWQELNS
jgi:predicted transcriptional regulator